MAEYIERETALNLISDIFFKTDPDGEEQCGVIKCSKAIRNAPTADVVEVVHGKWKLNKDGSGTCNQCHITQKNVWDYDNWQNYCGHCGAKMDGERRSENDKSTL